MSPDMNERQRELFKTIVSQYVKTAQPISSKTIAESGHFDLSPATIRNEMAALEEEGYISHPHTSAGRIPTEKGYRYFVQNFLENGDPSKRQQEILAAAAGTAENQETATLKAIARAMAELADNAVFVAFSADDFFYTGLANLFVQPEFIEHQVVAHLSHVMDHLDQVIAQLYRRTDFDVEIVIGAQNHFGRDCSLVLGTYHIDDGVGFFGILGPTRMDYQTNINLIKFSRELINHEL